MSTPLQAELSTVLAMLTEGRTRWDRAFSTFLPYHDAPHNLPPPYDLAFLELAEDEVRLLRMVDRAQKPPGKGSERELLGWAPWAITDPAQAQEALEANDLLPDGWCQGDQAGWYCDRCRGTGWVPRNGTVGSEFCDVCRQRDTLPLTMHDLVAVAALGENTLKLATDLPRQACADLDGYQCPRPKRILFSVGKRRERKGPNIPLAWWEREGGARVSMANVLSTDGIWYPEKGEPRELVTSCNLWEMGLCLDRITRDFAVVVVPNVGVRWP